MLSALTCGASTLNYLHKIMRIIEVNMAAESSHSVLEIPKERLALLSTIDNQSVCNLCGLLLSKLMGIV